MEDLTPIPACDCGDVPACSSSSLSGVHGCQVKRPHTIISCLPPPGLHRYR